MEAHSPLTKRDIMQAFGIKGDDRRDIKDILRDLEEDGAIIKTRGKEYTIPKGMPSVAVVEVTGIDLDGDMFATPVDWNEERQGPAPRVEIVPDTNKGHPALKEKDRVLVRLKRYSDKLYEGVVMKRLDDPRGQVMGQLVKLKNGYVLEPASKRAKNNFDVPADQLGGANEGDLVVGEIQPALGLQQKKVRIVQIIGRRDDPKAISLITLYEAGLSEKFPQDVIDTEGMTVPELGKRVDLRGYPLVTIDGMACAGF